PAGALRRSDPAPQLFITPKHCRDGVKRVGAYFQLSRCNSSWRSYSSSACQYCCSACWYCCWVGCRISPVDEALEQTGGGVRSPPLEGPYSRAPLLHFKCLLRWLWITIATSNLVPCAWERSTWRTGRRRVD